MEDENTNPDSSKKDNLGMAKGISEVMRLISQLNSFSDSMKQEAEQTEEMQTELFARFKELRRSGGSDENVKKVIDDVKATVSALERNNEKCMVQMQCLMDASKEKLKDIASIMEAEKSSSDKVEANPEGFLGKKENQAMIQRDDPEILKKPKGDHEPSQDVSKKWKADADSSEKEDDLLGVVSLKQDKYKNVVGENVKGESIVKKLKLKEQGNVSESAKKVMHPSKSLVATKEMDQSAGQPKSLGATKIEERKG